MEYLVLIIATIALVLSLRVYMRAGKTKHDELSDKEIDQIRQVINLMTYLGDNNGDKD